MFLHLSVILSTEGVVSQHALQLVSQHALQVSRPTPRGQVEGDLARGVSRPTPGGVIIPSTTSKRQDGYNILRIDLSDVFELHEY